MERIAGELKVDRREVRKALAATGLPPRLSRMQFPELYDPDWIRTELAQSSIAEVARRLGASNRSVRDAAVRAGVPPRRRTPPPRRLDDAEWLRGQLAARVTYGEIAARLGCAEKTVRRAVARHGLTGLARRRRRFPQLYQPGWLDAALAERSGHDIARELGCSDATVFAARRYLRTGVAALDDQTAR